MATRAARNQKAYRERRKALIQKRIALVLEVLDGIANGSNGIILTLDKDLWSINFHWGGAIRLRRRRGSGKRLGPHPGRAHGRD